MKSINIINRYVKGNALQYTLIIGVIIFILILTLVLYFHLNTLLSIKTDEKVTLIESHQEAFYSDELQKAIAKKSQDWGAFQKTTSYETVKGEQKSPFKSVALTALKWYKGTVPQLYLKKDASYLYISGSTKLEGELVIPYESIRTTNVAGYTYQGLTSDNLNIVDATEETPKHPSMHKSFKEWLLVDNDSIIQDIPYELTNSFLNNNITFMNDGIVLLDNYKLTGNIKIVSNEKVVISANSSLQDVLIIAPSIEVQADFTGVAHFVVSDTLIIHKNARLQFPSSIVVPINEKQEPLVFLDENVIFKGLLHQFHSPKEGFYAPNVILSTGSEFHGMLYNEGATSLKGKVYGSVLTAIFLADEGGNLYRNHIIDGAIYNPEWFALFSNAFNKQSKTTQPVQWLY